MPFGRHDFFSPKFIGGSFLQADSKTGAFSFEFGATKVRQMVKSSIIHNTSIAMNNTNRSIESIHVEEDPNKRAFHPYGTAAYLFIQIGAYGGGPAKFSIVGLASHM